MKAFNPFAFGVTAPRAETLGYFGDHFLQLHDSLSVPALWKRISDTLDAMMPLHSVSAYCNYFDCDGAFRLFHRQCGPGALLPWTVRQAVTPTPHFLREHTGVRLFRLDEMLPSESKLEKSAYYRKVMRYEGWRSLVCLAFWDRATPNFMLVLRRGPKQPDFTCDDLPVLQSLYRNLEVSLRRINSAEKDSATTRALAKLVASSSEAMLLVDWYGQIISHNAAGREAVQRWAIGPRQARYLVPQQKIVLPTDLVTACQRVRDSWSEAVNSSRRSNLQCSAFDSAVAPGERVEIKLIATGNQVLTRPLLSLRFFQSRLPTSTSILDAQSLKCLSRAETAVAEMVADGVSNKEAASLLGKSERTIKAQLTQVYRKLRVGGRSQLILRMRLHTKS